VQHQRQIRRSEKKEEMQSARITQQAEKISQQLEPHLSHESDSSGPVRILHLADDVRDAQSIREALHAAKLRSHIRHVRNRDGFEAALHEGPYHLILCDISHPHYDGISALRLARSRHPDVPVIVIASAQGEDQAMKCLHLGATDYLLKQRLDRLPNAVWRAISEAAEQRRLREAEAELRASEERFRLLAQHSKEVFWFVGLNPKRLLYVSPAVEDIWGAPVERFYEDNMFWQNAIDPEDRKRVNAAWDACANGDASRFDIEYRVIHSDGSVRLVAETGAVFVDGSRGAAHISGMVRDITERTRLEQELRQSHKMDGIGQLAGGIAHDFNNLLTVIQGNSDLALDELEPGSAVYADIREIKRAATLAAALTRQLLTFSRQQAFDPRPVDLCAVARRVERMLSRLLADNIELVLELDEECDSVLADEGQIEQVMMNLIVNARDAMPRGGRITIGICSVMIRPYGGTENALAPYVQLTVTDTGIGMDRATQDRIFEPFFTTKEVGRGTGLGLSTVHGIVKQSAGELHVSSEPGLGTTFTILIPQCDPELSGKKSTHRARAERGFETVLVVEDQPALRDLVRRVLEQRGYSVIEAANGDEALRIAGEAIGLRIHLVISDIVMPGMSAHVMAETLRAARPETRVLFMSGHHDNEDIRLSLESAKADFLQKPFLPYRLAEKVREVLER